MRHGRLLTDSRCGKIRTLFPWHICNSVVEHFLRFCAAAVAVAKLFEGRGVQRHGMANAG